MVIIKFKKSNKLDKYALYKRLSFREDGKVKKKDIYITSLNIKEVENKTYLDLDLAKEIEEAFNRYFIRQKEKQEQKWKERAYQSGLIGKLWNSKEEFENITWDFKQVPLDFLEQGYDYEKYKEYLKQRFNLRLQ